MMVSIVVSAEGIRPHEFCPEMDILDMCPQPGHDGLQCDIQFHEKGWSEYDKGVWGDTAETEEETGKNKIYSLDASGLVPWDVAMSYLDHIGAIYDGCQTMGTIGGPANPTGWAPDTSWNIETPLVIASIRVTPMVYTKTSWDRVLRLFGEYEPYKLARMGRRGKP